MYVDEAGRLREHTKIDNLHDPDNKDEFIDFLTRRKPDVAVVGGFSIATLKLSHLVKEMFRGSSGNVDEANWNPSNEPSFNIPTIFVNDDVARIYQHSKRAADEFQCIVADCQVLCRFSTLCPKPLERVCCLGS